MSGHGELDPLGIDKLGGGPVKVIKGQRATPGFRAGLGKALLPYHHKGWGLVMNMKNTNTWENMGRW